MIRELASVVHFSPRLRSAMSASMKLGGRLRSIAATWPVDPFRPNLQLKNFLTSLADHPNLTPEAVRAAHTLQDSQLQKKVNISAPSI